MIKFNSKTLTMFNAYIEKYGFEFPITRIGHAWNWRASIPLVYDTKSIYCKFNQACVDYGAALCRFQSDIKNGSSW